MTTIIESSVIDQLGYNETTQELSIRFQSGGGGTYKGVPRQLVGEMLTAVSAGAFFVRNIRNKFDYVPLTA